MDYDDENEIERVLTAEEKDDGTFAVTVRMAPPSRQELADALANLISANYQSGAELRAMVDDRLQQLVRELVDEAARAAITEHLYGVTRQPTDEFGNPVGEARTFAQMIGAQVKAWQDETVDTFDGKPKRVDPYNRDRVVTRAEYLIRQVGAGEFEKLARAEVAKVRAEAKARIDQTIKHSVAAALAALAPTP